MRYVVQILFGRRYYDLEAFEYRDDAEWAIARWRQQHGSNGSDDGFRVQVREEKEVATA